MVYLVFIRWYTYNVHIYIYSYNSLTRSVPSDIYVSMLWPIRVLCTFSSRKTKEIWREKTKEIKIFGNNHLHIKKTEPTTTSAIWQYKHIRFLSSFFILFSHFNKKNYFCSFHMFFLLCPVLACLVAIAIILYMYWLTKFNG